MNSKQNLRASLVLLCSAALTLVNCSKNEEPRSTLKTLETENTQAQINKYENNNSAEQKAKVESAFAELDSEIKELEVRIARTTGDDRAKAEERLADANKRRAELQADYNEAKFKALVEDVKNAVR
jgi:DNA repair exonuclease SbcCD ATPase subunit